MFDWILPEKHAIAVLKMDHDKVEDLFDRFEKTKSREEKENIIVEAVKELKIHAQIEEEIFYPAVRGQVETDVMNEADEEHHVVRVLIAELDHDGRGDDHRDAKFKVLSENVRHHIKEEEGDVLPKAKELDIDFVALGQRMLDRKVQLEADGVPSDAEHRMVAKANGKSDTPAAASRRKAPAASKAAQTAGAGRATKTKPAHSR